MDVGYGGLFAIFAAMGIVIILILGLIGIVNYLLISISLMNMANKEGIENPWLSWIPIAQFWIVGKLIKTFDVGAQKYDRAEVILVVSACASIFLTGLPLIGGLIGIANLIIMVLAIYKLYKMYAPENAILYVILSIIFVFIAPGIIMFKLKDKSQVVAAGTQE